MKNYYINLLSKFVLLLLLFSCSNKEIEVKIKNDKYLTQSDHYCLEVRNYWNIGEYYIEIFDGRGDIDFLFAIKDNECFYEGLDDLGYYDLDFFLEFNNQKYIMAVFFLNNPNIDDGTVFYQLKLIFCDAPECNPFMDIKSKKEMIKRFRDMLESCKLYVINTKGQRIDFDFIKESKFYIEKYDE